MIRHAPLIRPPPTLLRLEADMIFGMCQQLLDVSIADKVTSGSPHSSRRLFLSTAGTFLAGWFFVGRGLAAEGIRLAVQPRADYEHAVRALIDVAGDLKFNADGKEVKRLPMTVKAELQYDERFLTAPAGGLRSVRSYSQALAEMRINEQELRQELRPDRRIAASLSTGEDFRLYSPQGPLTNDELELINALGRIAGISALLRDQPVTPGESWEVPDAALLQLLTLDGVTQQDVKATFIELKDALAVVRFEGKVTGAVGGIGTEIELKGSLNVDVAKRQATWLALILRENRAIGHAQPGYEAVTKLRMVMEPTTARPELSNRVLEGMSLTGEAGDLLIELTTAKAGYTLYHDRRWKSMVDRHEIAVMRMVDAGDLLAQCNISVLPSLPKGEQLTLEGFQGDVRKSLDKTLGEFVEASQTVNENGLAVLRVTAVGKVQDVNVEWIYYHLTDGQGRRASLVFTLETSYVERFAGTDRAIVSSFRFIDKSKEAVKTTAQPTPAKPAEQARSGTKPAAK